MSNVIDNYYYDRRIHFEEIIETDGQTLDSNPLRSIETDVLALILFWNATGITPTSEEGGSKYRYWCNIIREHTRRSFEYEPKYNSPQVRVFANHNSNSDMDWNKEIMTPRKEDIDFASEILDYYKLKLSHRALTSDIPFSEYENKLSSFVNSERNQFTFNELGVIARLEETYNVDLVFDGFIKKYDSLSPSADSFDFSMTKEPLTLNFIKKLDVLGNKEQNIRYYFECNKELYCMKFPERNSLLNVLDKTIEDNNNVLNILGAIRPGLLYANSKFWYNTIFDGWTLKD
jgi:hypothetical protein